MATLASLALAAALVPAAAVTALAAEVEDAGAAALRALSSSSVTDSGTCGTVTWTLYGDGELNLAPTSGSTGTLESFQEEKNCSTAPWTMSDFIEDIVSVSITGTVVCGSNVCYMFAWCTSLTSVDLTGLDTSNVTDMHGMFYMCPSLTSLDLSAFDTSSVTNMCDMFCYYDDYDYGRSSLTTIYVSELWSTESVTDSDYMFTGCTSLVGGNGTAYSSSHVDSEYACIDTASTPGYFTYKAYEVSSSDSSSSSSGSSGTDSSSSGSSSAAATSISGAKVKLAKTSYTYSGKAKKPGVTVTLDGTTLTKGTDYTVTYSNNKNAGTAKVTVTGTGAYAGTATATFKIKKAKNTLKAKAAAEMNIYIGQSRNGVLRSKISDKASEFFTVTGAKGKVTYKRLMVKSNGKKLKGKQLKKIVVAKNGKITLKKGLKTGTYKVKVKVKVAGNGNYKAAAKTATVTIKVS